MTVTSSSDLLKLIISDPFYTSIPFDRWKFDSVDCYYRYWYYWWLILINYNFSRTTAFHHFLRLRIDQKCISSRRELSAFMFWIIMIYSRHYAPRIQNMVNYAQGIGKEEVVMYIRLYIIRRYSFWGLWITRESR